MESTSPISNQIIQQTPTSNPDRSRRKRRNKSPPSISQSPSPSPSTSIQKWRSDKEQQIYSTKLVHALRELRISQPSPPPPSGRAVRDVADRALAVTARGKTLWSRAILSKAVKLKFRKNKRQRIITNQTQLPVITGSIRSKKEKTIIINNKNMPAVQRKVKVLSRLVPGCRKQTLPVVLEETKDYIAAMEMQIRAMTAILSAVSSIPEQPPGHDGGQTHMLG